MPIFAHVCVEYRSIEYGVCYETLACKQHNTQLNI